MRALLDGPTDAERLRKITTAVPRAVRFLELGVAEGVARIDLSAEFQSPAAPDEIDLRVAQVVWTITEAPGIGAVAFSIDGDPATVTVGSGATSGGPVTRGDYTALAPPP